MTGLSRLLRITSVGVFQVLMGCVVGLIPPPVTKHFRSIVTAHIEFTANGTLLAVLGLLTPYMKLSNNMFNVLEATAYLGTFLNGGAFFISAFTGFGTKLAPCLHEKFPFPKGTEGGYSTAMTGILQVCAVNIITALSLATYGLVMNGDGKK